MQNVELVSEIEGGKTNALIVIAEKAADTILSDLRMLRYLKSRK
jgi:hypothetical protein